MKLLIQKGATSKSVYIFIRDASETDGRGLAGLVYSTANLVAYYSRPGNTATQITLVTLASATATYSSGGFVAVDGTNMPGLYRLDLPSAVTASGVDDVVVMLHGAADMEPVLLELQLVSFNPNDSAALGLTAVPATLDTDAISAAAVSSAAANKIRDAISTEVIETEGSITRKQAEGLVLAGMFGETDGGSFSTPNGEAVRATVTYAGNNRTGITLTPSS